MLYPVALATAVHVKALYRVVESDLGPIEVVTLAQASVSPTPLKEDILYEYAVAPAVFSVIVPVAGVAGEPETV